MPESWFELSSADQSEALEVAAGQTTSQWCDVKDGLLAAWKFLLTLGRFTPGLDKGLNSNNE